MLQNTDFMIRHNSSVRFINIYKTICVHEIISKQEDIHISLVLKNSRINFNGKNNMNIFFSFS